MEERREGERNQERKPKKEKIIIRGVSVLERRRYSITALHPQTEQQKQLTHAYK